MYHISCTEQIFTIRSNAQRLYVVGGNQPPCFAALRDIPHSIYVLADIVIDNNRFAIWEKEIGNLVETPKCKCVECYTFLNVPKPHGIGACGKHNVAYIWRQQPVVESR